jgi:hypothetical protein
MYRRIQHILRRCVAIGIMVQKRLSRRGQRDTSWRSAL